jgi:hypothetical protein
MYLPCFECSEGRYTILSWVSTRGLMLLFSIDLFCFGSSFFCWLSLLMLALAILLFVCQQTASLTLTCWHYCHCLNDSTASLLLFLVPIIGFTPHGFCCFFGSFLILLCSASLVLLLFCLVSFPSFFTFRSRVLQVVSWMEDKDAPNLLITIHTNLSHTLTIYGVTFCILVSIGSKHTCSDCEWMWSLCKNKSLVLLKSAGMCSWAKHVVYDFVMWKIW